MIPGWKQFEKDIANLLGGKITPGSGNGRIKGDIRTESWVVEAKYTEKDWMVVQADWLKNLARMSTERDVALALYIGNQRMFYFLEDGWFSKQTPDWSCTTIHCGSLPFSLEAYGTWYLCSWEQFQTKVKEYES